MSTPTVPNDIACNTLTYVFARMGLPPHIANEHVRKTPLAWFPYGKPFRQGLSCRFPSLNEVIRAPCEHCRKSYDFRRPDSTVCQDDACRNWRLSEVFRGSRSHFVRLCYKKAPFV